MTVASALKLIERERRNARRRFLAAEKLSPERHAQNLVHSMLTRILAEAAEPRPAKKAAKRGAGR